MNMYFAEVKIVFSESGMRFGKVRVGGALKTVPLELLPMRKAGIACCSATVSPLAKSKTLRRSPLADN